MIYREEVACGGLSRVGKTGHLCVAAGRERVDFQRLVTIEMGWHALAKRDMPTLAGERDRFA
jgi:hypothetical protein